MNDYIPNLQHLFQNNSVNPGYNIQKNNLCYLLINHSFFDFHLFVKSFTIITILL